MKIIVEKFDPESKIIREFQNLLFSDHGLDFHDLKSTTSHKKWIETVGDQYDDCYRWLPYKTQNYNDMCFIIMDGKPVNISFTRYYGDFMRVGIGTYTLRDYRLKVRNPLLCKKQGHFLQIMDRNKALGYFISYYAKNPTIAAVVKMLKKKRHFDGFSESPTYHSEFAVRDEPIIFHSVPQSIAYRNNSEDDNYNKLIELIKENKN